MKTKLHIILFLFLALSIGTYAQQNNKEITLNDVWASGKFFPKLQDEIQPLKDGEHFSKLVDGNIEEYEYKSGNKTRILVDAKKLIPDGQKINLNMDNYQFSSDESKVLITTDVEEIYRHSFTATFYIWDIKNEKLISLSSNGKQQLATFSSDGINIVFVRDNNLFIKNISAGTEEQITKDGLKNNIINGAPDWVYEEEFAFSRGFDWSPDGCKLAFMSFDESKVKEFEFQMYEKLYPETIKYKYPKAGEDNSVVSVFVYDLKTKTTKKMNVGSETNQYIPRIKWTNNPNQLCITRLNRLQNKLELLLANTDNGESKVMFTEENKYYIDITDNLTFLKNNKQFLWTSELDGYNHIYLYDMNGKLVKQITKGNWDVVAFKGMDETNGKLYYISGEEKPTQHNLYSIKLDGTDKKLLSSKTGWNEASFSKDMKYYINQNTNANTPEYATIHSVDGKELKVLEDNNVLKERMKIYNFSKKEFFSFKTSEGIELNAWMIKPINFDTLKKYPVFVYFYGGPGSQEVTDQWSYTDYVWHQFLAQHGYIVACVDNRGTGARGQEFKKCTYLQLGKLETIDQIEFAKYLSTLNYVNSERIGVFGWSYGGYLSTLCMTKGADYFKAGVAVAPVTNWRFYDNIYTERFMRTPQENAMGYDQNSPINHIKKLKGKFLLVHGTADDNVHTQNSFELINKLVENNKQFEMQFYPNKNHGIRGGNTRLHLFTKISDFIFNNL